VIESIREICTLLAGDPATVQEVADGLGTLVADQGGNLPLIVRPRYAAFSRGSVTRQFGTQRPAGVLLTVAESAELRVAELRAAFGEYAELPRKRSDRAPRIQIYLGEPAAAGSTSIIATLMPGQWENINDGTVSELIIQPEF
jgi:hypothetical protein